MNALQIMSPRNGSNQIDWDVLEHENFNLPPLYKIFHNTYDIETVQHCFNFAYKIYDRITYFGFYKHLKIPYLALVHIVLPNDLKLVYDRVIDPDDEIDKILVSDNLIPIGSCAGQELLLLGIGPDNSDKIFYHVRYLDEPTKLVSNNIFEFFRDYYIEIDEYYLKGISFDKFYKTWNDKFWSIREE